MGSGDALRRLNIDRIARALSDVQAQFEEINQKLMVRREYPTDEIIQNMLNAYHYLDDMLEADIELFSPQGLQHLVELNHIVLCGRDARVRMEYSPHIIATRERFYTLITPIMKWYKDHRRDAPLKVAAEIYVGVLSRPQLFIEGNHRTGALAASHILMRGGCPPFVLNINNALAYFEPSSQIKFSDKRSFLGKLRLPKYQKEFMYFLEKNISGEFVLGEAQAACEAPSG